MGGQIQQPQHQLQHGLRSNANVSPSSSPVSSPSSDPSSNPCSLGSPSGIGAAASGRRTYKGGAARFARRSPL